MRGNFRLALFGAIVAVVIVVPLAVFTVARALNEGEIAPNVSAAGVPIGGLSPDDATALLTEHRQALRESRAPFTVKGREFQLDPRVVGVDLDVATAIEHAVEARKGGGFFDQFADWVRSFSQTIEVPADVTFDDQAIEGVLRSWESTAIGNPAFEGGVIVVEGVATPEYPAAGEGIDRTKAIDLVAGSLQTLDRPLTELPTEELVPVVTDADVDQAVELATRLIDAPVTLNSADPELSIEIAQDTLAQALYSTVVTDPQPHLQLGFNTEVLGVALEPHRSTIEQPARNARFRIGANDVVTVSPSREQTILDLDEVSKALVTIAAGPDRGLFPFRYGEEPNFTTEEARAMGPIRRITTQTTSYNPGEPRVTNIKTISQAVDGAVVWPGETFSLNEHVGPRTEEKGYVAAPQILAGEFVDEIGGGVSQFATTMFNTMFFSCIEIVEHRPHSFYFDRYPEGREATISWTHPDLKFRNDTDSVIIIKSYASDNAVSVAFFGNNGGRECEAGKSERYNITEPEVQFDTDSSLPPTGETIVAYGKEGWMVDITRTITYADGATSTQEWTHRYLPQPRIIRSHPCVVPNSGVACPKAVPNVVGLSFSNATARLDEAGFKIADGGAVSVSSQGQDGLVQSQSTSAGAYAGPGSTITVTIGRYTATTTTSAPTTTAPPGDG